MKKELKPWDIHNHQGTGDEKEDTVFIAVGRALTSWNRLELSLAILFANLIDSKNLPLITIYGFGAVRTFEARRDMLKKVSSAYFKLCPQNDEMKIIQEKLKIFLDKKCKKAAERRNDIAHGTVVKSETVYLGEGGRRERGCFLTAAGADSSKNDFLGDAHFRYSSKELNDYTNLFSTLSNEADEINSEILKMPKPFGRE